MRPCEEFGDIRGREEHAYWSTAAEKVAVRCCSHRWTSYAVRSRLPSPGSAPRGDPGIRLIAIALRVRWARPWAVRSDDGGARSSATPSVLVRGDVPGFPFVTSLVKSGKKWGAKKKIGVTFPIENTPKTARGARRKKKGRRKNARAAREEKIWECSKYSGTLISTDQHCPQGQGSGARTTPPPKLTL